MALLNKIAHLKSRKILKLTGKNIIDILQRISTNDFSKVETKFIYTTFLNPKSKFLFDCFAILDKNQNEILLDIKKKSSDLVLSTFGKYNFRNQFKIEPLETPLNVYSLPSKSKALFTDFNLSSLIFDDTRSKTIGLRAYVEASEIRKLQETRENAFNKIFGAQNAYEEDFYSSLCMAEGIVGENYELDPGKSFPLHFGLEQLGGISTKKGCYIGQERISRTMLQGVLRKKALPVVLLKDGFGLPEAYDLAHTEKAIEKLDFGRKLDISTDEKVIAVKENGAESDCGEILAVSKKGNLAMAMIKTGVLGSSKRMFLEKSKLSVVPYFPKVVLGD